MEMSTDSGLRAFLTGGHRRSIAQSDYARALVEKKPHLVAELATLAEDSDWLVSQRALDLLEKFAHDNRHGMEPYKQIFIGELAETDKWEIRLQIVRALPLFEWSSSELPRVTAILRENVSYPQTFVKAWALDSLATMSEKDAKLKPIVRRELTAFEKSPSKALQARAKKIRQRTTF